MSDISGQVLQNAQQTSEQIETLDQRIGEILRELRESAVGNRRADPRFKGNWTAVGIAGGATHKCRLTDLSAGGALIGENLGLGVGEEIKISVDGITGEIVARIVNVSRKGTHLQFPADDAVRHRVTQFLQSQGHLEEAA